jgi:hypothetical protein
MRRSLDYLQDSEKGSKNPLGESQAGLPFLAIMQSRWRLL